MRNLSINLKSPEFEDHVSVIFISHSIFSLSVLLLPTDNVVTAHINVDASVFPFILLFLSYIIIQ